MFARLRILLGRKPEARPCAVPAGQRAYAIGDVHGRADLFGQLIDLIEADDAARGTAQTTIVMLGDLIDRGPDSAGVVARARELARRRRVEFLIGNHEEMLLASRTQADALRGFLRYGGLETLLSYGIPDQAIMAADIPELQELMIAAIPPEDFTFIEAFRPMVRIGDYLFVHAGINPHLPIADQDERECRWIREPFLSHKGDLGAIVVHGHTIAEAPEVRPHRIGIDTGAYVHGTLTAIGLQGDERWFLQARDTPEGDPGAEMYPERRGMAD